MTTHFGGFINAVGPAAGKNINDGEPLWRPRVDAVAADCRAEDHSARRLAGRARRTASIARKSTTSTTTSSPPRTTSATGRAHGLSEDAGAVPATRPSLPIWSRATISAPAELTSVSSYVHRNILVSRDASALTGSVIASISGFPAAGIDLPSNLRDTHQLEQCTQELASPRPARARSSGCSAVSTARSTATIASACQPRAMTRSAGLPCRRRRAPRRASTTALACRQPLSRRPAVRGQAKSAVRRSELQDRPVQDHRPAAAGTTSTKPAGSIPAACSRMTTTARRQDEVERLQPARNPQLGAEPKLQRQRPGRQGLPPRRRQRSAQRAALLRRRHCDLRPLPDLQGRDSLEL